jgi:hypothetical protein
MYNCQKGAPVAVIELDMSDQGQAAETYKQGGGLYMRPVNLSLCLSLRWRTAALLH